MKRVILSVAVIAALLAVSTPAFAQQTRKAAVIASSGSSIGLLLHTGESISIRPEFFFSKNSNEIHTGSSAATVFDTWQLGGAVSGLFYMGKPAAFRTYLSPRFAVSHSDSNSTGANSYAVSGSFGAQQTIGDRFHVFGEFGVNYGWQSSESASSLSLTTTTSKSHSFGTRAVVGAGFYF